MPRGSCACGEFTYEVPEQPTMTVVCHCIPCQKFAGINGSTNAITPKGTYKRLTGDVRQWTRDGDSGKKVTNNYCSNCNTLMHVDIEAMPDVEVYKAGTLDDKASFDGANPVQEIYNRNRPNCLEALKGCEQKEAA